MIQYSKWLQKGQHENNKHSIVNFEVCNDNFIPIWIIDPTLAYLNSFEDRDSYAFKDLLYMQQRFFDKYLRNWRFWWLDVKKHLKVEAN
jgi:hypothetical protein